MYLIQATWPVWKKTTNTQKQFMNDYRHSIFISSHTHTYIHTLPLAANFHVDLSYLVVS